MREHGAKLDWDALEPLRGRASPATLGRPEKGTDRSSAAPAQKLSPNPRVRFIPSPENPTSSRSTAVRSKVARKPRP